jgi:hypothetical protein
MDSQLVVEIIAIALKKGHSFESEISIQTTGYISTTILIRGLPPDPALFQRTYQ